MGKTFSYSKIEKLKSRKLTEGLFANGRSFTVFPLKVFYLLPGEKLDFYVKTGVGASGRNFKRAVDRNSIKRLLREAYRTEKLPLHNYLQANSVQVAMFILYVDKVLPTYGTIKAKMPVLMQRLIKELHAKAAKNT
jgi:ribonuclease P protein component